MEDKSKKQQSGSGGQTGKQDAGVTAGQTDLQKLQADLDKANKNIAELTETAKRALADLQNYRRLVEQERAEFALFATAALLLDLLPIADNFQRAFAHVPEEIKKTEWFKGVMQIEQQLVGLLNKNGIKEMPSTVGQKLDPTKHEAVAAGEGEAEVILEEYEKGYMMGQRVLRPAKVKVGKGEKTA